MRRTDMMATATRILAAVLVAAPAAACSGAASQTGPVTTGLPPAQHTSLTASDVHCGIKQDTAAAAPGKYGLNPAGATAPIWSGRIGRLATTVGQALYLTGENCVAAATATSGQLRWTASPDGHPDVASITASPRVVVVAVGNSRGTAPAAVYSVIDHVIGLDPSTGHELWSRAVGDDGQGQVAVIAGHDVVVSETDGTVLGLADRTGQLLWQHPAPAGCVVRNDGGPETPPLLVRATSSLVVAGYDCDGTGSRVIGYTPGTGAQRWIWRSPGHSDVQLQAQTSAAGGVVAIPIFGDAAQRSVRSARHRDRWALPQSSETVTVVALDVRTGTPRWSIGAVPYAMVVLHGPDRLCLAAAAGLDCRVAASGTDSWRWRPVVTPPRNSGGLMFDGLGHPGVIAAGGRIYWAAPTLHAPPNAGVPPSDNSFLEAAFELRAMATSDGHVISQPLLPAYNGGTNGVGVSASSPPGVLAATGVGGRILVTPQLDESDVIEAFAS